MNDLNLNFASTKIPTKTDNETETNNIHWLLPVWIAGLVSADFIGFVGSVGAILFSVTQPLKIKIRSEDYFQIKHSQ